MSLDGLPLRHFRRHKEIMQLTSRRSGPLRGTVTVPGDKSCSHRALILAAMARGTSRISGFGTGEDVVRTRAALEAFGIAVGAEGHALVVEGGAWRSPAEPIDCGNSGTTARLLIGALAGMAGVSASFTGDPSLSRRPMQRLVEPLRAMGARIEGGDTLPLTVHGASLGGIDHENVPASAQVKSAILLAGLGSHGPVRVREPLPSRDHGEIMLSRFGIALVSDKDGVELGPNRTLQAADIRIAGDPSSAAFPLAAAALVPGSSVTVTGLLLNPLRTGFLEALGAMDAAVSRSGERVQSGELAGDATVCHAPLRPALVQPKAVPGVIDELPILAAAAALAEGESRFEEVGELRHKESDRLAAIVDGLRACGVEAGVAGDSVRVRGTGAVRGGALVAAHGDHRIAMAFLVLGLASERPIAVDSAEMIATSFPGFVETMRSLGAEIE